MVAKKTPSSFAETRHEVRLYMRREGLSQKQWLEFKPHERYRRWLDALGLTYEKFARNCSLPYNTVFKWGQARRPRPSCLELVKITYPDCPLVLEYLGR